MHQRGVERMDILGAGSAESSSALGHIGLIESLLFREDYLVSDSSTVQSGQRRILLDQADGSVNADGPDLGPS